MADELVTIATYSDAMLAHIVQAKLESEEIESYVLDENVATLFGNYSPATKGIKLQVRQSDAERACQIIESGLSESAQHQPDALPDAPAVDAAVDIRCPKCDSENIHFQKPSRAVGVVGIILLGFRIPFLKRKWTCSDCWHQWKQK